MLESSADRDPLERLAEEFVGRVRAGFHPSLTEYMQRYPDLADAIQELFPALVEMEQLKPVTGDRSNSETPAMDPADPVQIGEFRILRRVGRGGMGIVYEAVQESLGRHVALKLLPIDALADPKRLERFRREAKAAARLHHTNIVPVFGTGESEGRHFYAMQFIAGHPLDAVIDEVRRLKADSLAGQVAKPARPVAEVAAALLTGTFLRRPPQADLSFRELDSSSEQTHTHHPQPAPGQTTGSGLRRELPSHSPMPSSPTFSGSFSEGGQQYFATVARIGEQVADALAYAHVQGILHRDIKPANLLLDLHGVVWVTDFGLAKATDTDDLTRAGDVVGTLRYMAPERFDGQGDLRADVYALGLTLYEMLTLKPAFAADTKAKLIEQVLAAAPPSPRSINPAIPRDLETVVLKAIARDPAMRYATATEMAEDLRRYQEDRPIHARRASSVEKAYRWCRRNPAVASLLTTVLLVFACGATVASYFALRAESRAREANDQRNLANLSSQKLRTEEERIRRLLYGSQMNHASYALSEGRIQRVLEILDETSPAEGEPDLRGWEWHYLNRLTTSTARTIELVPPADAPATLKDAFISKKVSADGRRLVLTRLVEKGYRLEVWDLQNGRLLNQFDERFEGDSSKFDSLSPTISISADSRFLTSSFEVSDEEKPGIIMLQLRTWDVDSGQELSVHKVQRDGLVNRRVDYGFSTANSFCWLEATYIAPVFGFGMPADLSWMSRRSFGEGMNPENSMQAPEYLLHRWDRATGQINSQRFRPGTGNCTLTPTAFSSDRRITIFQFPPRFFISRDNPSTPQISECWDISANPPQRLGTFPYVGNLIGEYPIGVSPTGKRLAVASGKKITVYRTEPQEGELSVDWQFETGFDNVTLNTMAVSDEGHVAFSEPNTVTLYYPAIWMRRSGGPKFGGPKAVVDFQPSIVAREVVWHHREAKSPPVLFSGDSQSLLAISDRTNIVVQCWQLPKARAEIRLNREGSALSPDGRLQVEWSRPTVGKKPEDFVTVKDVRTGVVLHRIPGWTSGNIMNAAFVAGSERLLIGSMQMNSSSLPKGPNPNIELSWKLFETENYREINRGSYTVNRFGRGNAAPNSSPGGRWFIENSVQTGLIVRDALTGAIVCRPKLPPDRFVLDYQFDAAENRLAVLVPTTTSTPTEIFAKNIQSITVQVYDLPAGALVWERSDFGTQIADLFNTPENRCQMLFTPDCQRLLLCYPADAGQGKVWVGSAKDGTTQHTFEGVDQSNSSGPLSRINFLSVDRASSRIAIHGNREVLIWDLESGTRTMRLHGHDGSVRASTFSPDGNRLFLNTRKAQSTPKQPSKIYVWDLSTNRALLVLDASGTLPPEFNGYFNPGYGEMKFQGGKLELRGGLLPIIFDGTPMQP